ncbi:hypothetical protein D3OALGA1CA_554 [Olavius algarvensis associated proteobacterium Delta 3]|nr:hypothetical protein D3OALGA1CA_554 [Olavius algarvensis associated proteobacterium Delta 3]CAB5138952.1 hypothetical protein D3OALGB2SA_4114 [Olavius algarvensis associated proteobacterium Delta 3]
MTTQQKGDLGIKMLVSRYRKQFRIEENTGFYSKNDFEAAEKKFIKFAIRSGWQITPGTTSSASRRPVADPAQDRTPSKTDRQY